VNGWIDEWMDRQTDGWMETARQTTVPKATSPLSVCRNDPKQMQFGREVCTKTFDLILSCARVNDASALRIIVASLND